MGSPLIALAIFALAFAVRLFYLGGIEAYPKFELIRNRLDDQFVFDVWAKAIVEGRAFDYPALGHDIAGWASQFPDVFPQSPLYACFLATLYQIFGFNYDLVRLLQMLIGAIGCVLIYAFARRLCAEWAAILCGIAASLYGPFVFYEATFLRSSILTGTTAACLFLLLTLVDRDRRTGLLGLVTGLLLAAAVLLRPNMIFFAFAAIAWLYWARRFATPLATIVPLTAGLLAPLLLVSAVNTARSGRLTGLSSNGGFVLVACNVADPWGDASPLPMLDASDSLSDFAGLIVAEAQRDPGTFFAMQIGKAQRFFHPVESPNNLSFAMARQTNPRLALAFVDFAWIAPLALCGLIASLRDPRRYALLYLFMATYIGSTLIFCVHGRLRQPAAIGCLVFAAIALDAWVGLLKRGRLVSALAAAAVVIGLWSWTTTRVPRHRDNDYAMAAAAYYAAGAGHESDNDPEHALASYAKALSLNPSHRQALVRIAAIRGTVPRTRGELPEAAATLCREGRVLAEEGELEAALAKLEDAEARAPLSEIPQQYLSNVYFLLGDRWRAMRHLERAVELRPLNQEYRDNLRALRETL